MIDGRDIRSYNIRHLRSNIALVGQEPTLFNISIRDNIAYGMEDALQENIEAAAKLANIHSFIIALPQVCLFPFSMSTRSLERDNFFKRCLQYHADA